ncbi:MAG: indole-3-glycerol phosphate synthase TrpC [Spirochaetia bacterium]|nr:indole-3-glycerol phosphate synthase TrpC [Spirochaetia bacterium]
MSVLNEIINERKKDLAAARILTKKPTEPTNKNFIEALQRKNKIPALIAELKRKSPSKGDIRPEITVEEAVKIYEPYAAALSILTEPRYFGGSLNDLALAAAFTKKPLLRKDFLIDPVQVKESRLFGADAYLLIAAALSDSQLQEMIEAGKDFNMPALVEVHNEEETERALNQNIKILGINNRNLSDLSIDLNNTANILKIIPKEKLNNLIIVSESGFQNKEQLENLPSDVNAVLMGTAFMQAENPQDLISSIFS